jgi:hypothetical protein
VEISLGEGAFSDFGFDVRKAGVGKLVDFGDLLNNVEKSDFVLTLLENHILQVGNGDHFDGNSEKIGIVGKGMNNITEVGLHKSIVGLMLLVDFQELLDQSNSFNDED